MVEIPKQLQNEKFRFVLIATKSKAPFEYTWQTKNNYPFNHNKITNYKGNFGIVCGYGELVVLDIDNNDFLERFDKVDTFSVETGTKKRHYYFFCGEKFQKNYYILNKSVGELRVTNSQVVIPPSIHPNGNEYKVFNDVPIKKITKKQLRELLSDLLIKEERSMDISRSGQDWADVCEMIEANYSFDEVDKELMLIGSSRWKSEGIGYKVITYCNALKVLKRVR